MARLSYVTQATTLYLCSEISAAHPHGKHWTRVSVGSFVLMLPLLRYTGDSQWLDCKTRRFLFLFSELHVKQQTRNIFATVMLNVMVVSPAEELL